MSEAMDLALGAWDAMVGEFTCSEGERRAAALDREIIRAALDLGDAWAEAEAALPEGWQIKSLSMDAPPDWQAWAGGTPEETREGDAWEAESGPTPAAALRALAAKLREVRR